MAGDKQHSVLRPKGTLIITDWDGCVEEHDTLQCCHCGAHWVVSPGSGRRRGWCMKCGDVTCGEQRCDQCTPYKRVFAE